MAVKRFGSVSKTNHKPYLIILLELLTWIISNRGGINVYFDYELYLQGKKSGDYVKEPLFRKIEKELNSPSYFPILEDKYFFHQVLEGHGFRSPINLFLLDPSGIYNFKSGKYCTQEEFLQSDFDGFCKVVNGYGGKMIYKLKLTNRKLFVNDHEVSVLEFFQILAKRKFVIQERISQHEKMNVLNPSCINTLRMLTIREGQNYHYYSGFLRIGINNSIVDNLAQGNLTVGIERESGILMPYAYSAGISSDHNNLVRHPQTQTKFKDFEIPYYEEAVEMVKSMHVLFQQFFMIGWDIGITPDGPIVIEGNNITTLNSFQVFHGGMKESFLNLADGYRKDLAVA